MRSIPFGILCSAAAIVTAAPVLAASDYFLVIDGVDGESSSVVEVQSWSWGASNSAVAPNLGSSGQDGVAREKPWATASQNTQSLRESPSKPSTKRAESGDCDDAGRCTVGDLDGYADLAALSKTPEVSGFTLTLAPGPAARSACAAGKHIAKAHLVARATVYDLENILVSSCAGGGSGGALKLQVTGQMKEYRGHVTLMK